MIEKTTQLYALIGDNLAHDKRPQIVNYLFGQGGDDAALIPMNIRPDDLSFTLKGLKKSQIKGAIVDAAYYEEAVLACDTASSSLVDTLCIHDEKLIGSFHLPQDLCDYVSFHTQRVLIIGTTPLAHALASYLASQPLTSLCCAAPSLEEALEFTSKLDGCVPLEQEWFSSTRSIDLSHYDIIINATSLRTNTTHELPVLREGSSHHTFIDFTLTRDETYFSSEAKKYKAKAILGYDVATFQARNHYQRWCDKSPVIDDEHHIIITEEFTRECQLTKGLTYGQ